MSFQRTPGELVSLYANPLTMTTLRFGKTGTLPGT